MKRRHLRASRLTRREAIAGLLFISPWFVGFLVLTVLPLIVMLGVSLLKYDLRFVQFRGLRNYAQLTRDALFWTSLRVTLTYAAIFVPASLVVGLMIALLMNQEIKGRGIFRTIFYMPAIMSGVAVALVWKWIFNPDVGLANTLLALAGIQGPKWLTTPQWALLSLIVVGLWGIGRTMLIYLSGLQGIPTELYEAGSIDGTNIVQRLWHITLPMISPVILFNAIIEIIIAFQTFTLAYIMTAGGPQYATYFYALNLYKQVLVYSNFGYGSAMGVILFIIILGLTLLTLRMSQQRVYYAGL